MSRGKEIYKLFVEAKIARNNSLYVRETEEEILKWQKEMDRLNRDINTVNGCYNRVLDEFEMRIRVFKNGYAKDVSEVVIGRVPAHIIHEVETIFKSEELFEAYLHSSPFGENLTVCLNKDLVLSEGCGILVLSTEEFTCTEQDVAAIKEVFKNYPNEAIILTDSYLKGIEETKIYAQEANDQMADAPIDLLFVQQDYALMALKSANIDLENLLKSEKGKTL